MQNFSKIGKNLQKIEKINLHVAEAYKNGPNLVCKTKKNSTDSVCSVRTSGKMADMVKMAMIVKNVQNLQHNMKKSKQNKIFLKL